jgi:hypothetical protein
MSVVGYDGTLTCIFVYLRCFAVHIDRHASAMLRTLSRTSGISSKLLLRPRTLTTDSSVRPAVVGAAVSLLDGKIALLAAIRARNPEHYRSKDLLVGGSVGGHMRHSIAHFEKLMASHHPSTTAADDRIETVHYDVRERHTAVEVDAAAATAAVEALLSSVKRLHRYDMQRPVHPAFMLTGTDPGEHLFKSNMERELWFCCHHAMHHMAMAALVLRRFGGYDDILAASSLGIAPSTQLHNAVSGK